MSSIDSYVLKVGAQGRQRLDILNKIFSPTSKLLLQRAGLKPGNNVLEVGCGTGNVTCLLAQQVGEKGSVYAVDISGEQIALAKEKMAQLKINNVQFIESSVLDLNELAHDFDMVYGRFILMHLPEPVRALAHLKTFLKPGGTMAFEEGTNAVIACYPANEAFLTFRRWFMELSAKKNLDFNFGEKVYGYFRDLELHSIHTNFVQPIYQKQEEKLAIPLVVEELKSSFVKYDIASEDTVNKLIQQLHHFTADDQYLVSFPRITQIFGKI